MKRTFMFITLLAGALAFGLVACGDDDGTSCGDGTCNGGEDCETCPDDCGTCGFACDGTCEAGESCRVGCDDCCTQCDTTGTNTDYIVSELFLPTTSQEAGDNGVDIDGDGDIDNKLGQIIQLLVQNGLEGDLNESINGEIAEGSLLLLGRVIENGDNVVAVQIFQGEIFDATPVFDGNDSILISDDSPRDLYLCGNWDPGDLETDPSQVTIAFPLPEVGLLEVTLDAAQVRTVDDPDSPFYGDSEVTSTGWTNVMIGGGLSQDEIYGPNGLIEFLATFIQDMVDEGGSTADTIADLFDGNCVVLDDVAGCENVVAGVGECDDTADPPVITVTELKCNALLSSALSPDVDSDGDGEDDLLSLGLRVAAAVPVTIEN